VVPPSILHRVKKGFPVPVLSWLRHDMRDLVRDSLLSRDSACRKFFDPQAIEEIVTVHERGKSDGYQDVWSLLIFESWHKQFIENVISAPISVPHRLEVDAYAGRGV
jgi:asparagine synthase (glutamine-hydrolysing)